MEGTLVYDVVVATALRPSLPRLLESLGRCVEPLPRAVHVVADADGPLPAVPGPIADRVRFVRSHGRGPAAARNAGWRAAAGAPWVAFLDDDVVVPPGWTRRLAADLAPLDDTVAGSQGRVVVPLPATRRPTDWERNVAGLAGARWATADMAYRRGPLRLLGGFDERFRRAYREDADVALRLLEAGFGLVEGSREVVHPVGPAGFWASVRAQAGNADDALMAVRHGRDWRKRAGAPRGRRPRHLAIGLAGAGAVVAALAGRTRAAAAGAALWAAGTAELAWARIAPGPRAPSEVVRMVATSAAIPLAASAWWGIGWVRVARAGTWRGPVRPAGAPRARLGHALRPDPGAVVLGAGGQR